MILSKCAVYYNKKWRSIKKQESTGLLSNLGLKTLLTKIPQLGDILFSRYHMNEITNTFLLAGDKFKLQVH